MVRLYSPQVPKEKGFAPTLIVLLVTLLISGYLIYSGKTNLNKSSVENNQTPQSNSPSQNADTQNPTATTPVRTDLPKITDRNAQQNTTSWAAFSDPRGYNIHYPSNWFIAGGSKVQQIQNWDPYSDRRPGPLSADDSKWDVGFELYNFTSLDQVLSYASPSRISRIEKSKTKGGLDVYFMEGTISFFGNEDSRVPVVNAVVIENNKFFNWYGYMGAGQKNAEILKQILESLEK